MSSCAIPPGSTPVRLPNSLRRQSKISVRRPGDDSFLGNAKSIIIMLSMGVGQGDSIEILADGPDEQQAVESLTALVESGFGEI